MIITTILATYEQNPQCDCPCSRAICQKAIKKERHKEKSVYTYNDKMNITIFIGTSTPLEINSHLITSPLFTIPLTYTTLAATLLFGITIGYYPFA